MSKQSKIYVSMTDKFMSAWGKSAYKINKLVFECDSFDEALKVQSYANTRKEMKYINICLHKPYYNPDKYYVQYRTKVDKLSAFYGTLPADN